MCGIALLIGRDLSAADAEYFEAMIGGIVQRGESLEQERGPTTLLATSRLKIVDRARAQQPWRSADGRYSLCYNGEIFNHAELRGRLEAEGVRFRSMRVPRAVSALISEARCRRPPVRTQ